MKLKFFLQLFVIIICVSFFTNIFADYSIKYYDPINVKKDYRGVLSFKNSFQNIKTYLLNSWNYYIAYYNNFSQLVKYQYLENGNIIFEERFFYKNKKLVKVKKFSKGQIIYVIYLNMGLLKTKKLFFLDKNYFISFYSEKKRLIKVIKYNLNHKIVNYTLINYNSKGLKSLYTYYSNLNKPIGYVQFNYKNGFKSKVIQFNSFKKLINFKTFLYEEGRLREIKYYDAKIKYLGSSKYEYNSQNQVRYILQYNSRNKLLIH